MQQEVKRVQALDIMRGFAVIVMVMGHSIDSVLSVESRTTEFFQVYNFFRGFTAPIFLFVSGYVYTIATEKWWQDHTMPSRRMGKRLLRILLLFGLGYALHFPYFSFTKLIYHTSQEEYAQMFQVDVLQCVAASLLVLQGLVFISRTPRRFALSTLALSVLIILSTPIVWSVDLAPALSPALSPYFNQQQVSPFPLFPYAGFLFLGAVTGYFYLEARRAGEEHSFFTKLAFGGLLVGVCGLVFEWLPLTVYPPHDFWKSSPNFFLIRISLIMLVTAAFFYLRRIPDWAGRQIVVLGQASLMVYVLHLIIVYGSAANLGLRQKLGETAAFPEAFTIGIVVLIAMLAMVHAWTYLRSHHDISARFLRLGLASTILYIFLSSPY